MGITSLSCYNMFMGRPPKYSYPADDELVDLVRLHRNLSEIARHLNIPNENLRTHIQRRPDLKEQVYALLPDQYENAYPPDEELIERMRVLGSHIKVAESCGVRRESLRDYLKRRPQLKAAMDAVGSAAGPGRRLYSDAERKERNRESGRRYAARMRAQDPEKTRAQNRKWGRNQSPEKRAKWNNYNRLRRKAAGAPALPEEVPTHLYKDLCSYCGGSAGTVDHIIPVNGGGTNGPDNFTAACWICNASKGAKSLLLFLLQRRCP